MKTGENRQPYASQTSEWKIQMVGKAESVVWLERYTKKGVISTQYGDTGKKGRWENVRACPRRFQWSY